MTPQRQNRRPGRNDVPSSRRSESRGTTIRRSSSPANAVGMCIDVAIGDARDRDKIASTEFEALGQTEGLHARFMIT